MLNTDQHNKNHTKINDPMTAEQFKRNLRGTNGDKDHDQDMLEEIYNGMIESNIPMCTFYHFLIFILFTTSISTHILGAKLRYKKLQFFISLLLKHRLHKLNRNFS